MIRTIYLLVVNPEALDREEYNKHTTPDERLVEKAAQQLDYTFDEILYYAGKISGCRMTQQKFNKFYSQGTLDWPIRHCIRHNAKKLKVLIDRARYNSGPYDSTE